MSPGPWIHAWVVSRSCRAGPAVLPRHQPAPEGVPVPSPPIQSPVNGWTGQPWGSSVAQC